MARPVFIIDGSRTPFLKARSGPGPFTPVDLAVQCGRPLLARQPFAATAFVVPPNSTRRKYPAASSRTLSGWRLSPSFSPSIVSIWAASVRAFQLWNRRPTCWLHRLASACASRASKSRRFAWTSACSAFLRSTSAWFFSRAISTLLTM